MIVHRARRINPHPVNCDEHSPPERISDTEYWLNWDEDLDYPDDRVDDCTADIKSDIDQDNAIKVKEYPKQQDVRASGNVSRSIWSKVP